MGLHVWKLDKASGKGEKIMELVLSISFGVWYVICGVVYFMVTKNKDNGGEEK